MESHNMGSKFCWTQLFQTYSRKLAHICVPSLTPHELSEPFPKQIDMHLEFTNIQVQEGQTLSISSKFLSNQTNQCEQCEYKTSKYNSMYSHMRVKHTDLRIKCTECNFSHPTKVNTHFKQVHLGQKKTGTQK